MQFSRCTDDDFVKVTRKHRLCAKRKGCNVSNCAPLDTPGTTSLPLIVRNVEVAKSELKNASLHLEFYAMLKQYPLFCESMEIVCYGLGPFAHSFEARYQLALLLLVREKLGHPITYAFDPCWTCDERRFLTENDIKLIDNDVGFRNVYSPTLFYMPHCGRPLYNNLLCANWNSDSLRLVIIFGNRFRDLNDRMTRAERDSTFFFLSRSVQWLSEFQPQNISTLDTTFNDVWLQWFENITSTDPVWFNHSKPVYSTEEMSEIVA